MINSNTVFDILNGFADEERLCGFIPDHHYNKIDINKTFFSEKTKRIFCCDKILKDE